MHIVKGGMSWNKVEPPEMSWSYLELSGTSWNHLEPDELSNKLTQKNKKPIEETVRAIPLLNRIQY